MTQLYYRCYTNHILRYLLVCWIVFMVQSYYKSSCPGPDHLELVCSGTLEIGNLIFFLQTYVYGKRMKSAGVVVGVVSRTLFFPLSFYSLSSIVPNS